MNRKYFDISLWMLLGLVASIIACSDPAEEARKEEEDRVADSVGQAEMDQADLLSYIESRGVDKNKIDTASITDNELNLVYYTILELGEGRAVLPNDILSVDFIGRFTDTVNFDTSIEEWAITNDTIAYPAAGLDFESILDHFEGDLTKALDSAQKTETLDYNLYVNGKSYSPFVYNHIEDGSGFGGAIPGFTLGMQKLIPQLQEGGRGEIYIPSAVAYGTAGFPDGAILPNTPLVFEVRLSDIKPTRE
ncbi:FKBP-type peptidyl-prolyl cis-trans isomerase [Reichenbachiella versicolor]|uniref:FKBP-type peptidyl-prolyl cis-trans isomerase n=1 Tax=Reichenbachiella versicolor TaxID=1821036 RepID=UPI000D6E724C|nr:FKBP-type peptidyl-prolyl cis-trans isomerase [Reichenbachiella versicolor]